MLLGIFLQPSVGSVENHGIYDGNQGAYCVIHDIHDGISSSNLARRQEQNRGCSTLLRASVVYCCMEKDSLCQQGRKGSLSLCRAQREEYTRMIVIVNAIGLFNYDRCRCPRPFQERSCRCMTSCWMRVAIMLTARGYFSRSRFERIKIRISVARSCAST